MQTTSESGPNDATPEPSDRRDQKPPGPPSLRRGTALTAALAVLMTALTILAGVALVARTPAGPEKSAAARGMERKLEENPPDILVLGNSIAPASIETAILEAALGAPATTLWVPHSNSPEWYVVLKNRVYAAGYAPRLIIIPTFVHSALGLGLKVGFRGEHHNLEGHMTTHEPVIEDKVFSREGSALVRRARRNKRDIRAIATWASAHMVVGMVPGPSPDPYFQRGRSRSEQAFDRIFDMRNLIPERQENRVLDRWQERKPAPPPPVDEGLVVDLLDLAEAHKAKVVFVRLPAAPGNVFADPVTLEEEWAFVSYLNARGAGYLDFRSLPLGPDDFRDRIHMDTSGRTTVTETLAQTLQIWGGLKTLTIPPAPMPASPPTIERIGDPPEAMPLEVVLSAAEGCPLEAHAPFLEPFVDKYLGPLGLIGASPFQLLESGKPMKTRPWELEACRPGDFVAYGYRLRFRPYSRWPWTKWSIGVDPDPAVRGYEGQLVHWVVPGTRLRFSFDRGWADTGPFQLDVAAQPFAGLGVDPEVRVANGPTKPLLGHGGRLVAHLESPSPPIGPWSFEIVSPEGGPFLAIHSVSAGHPLRSRPIVALEHGTLGPTIQLLGGDLIASEPTWEKDPPGLPPHLEAPVLQRGIGRKQKTGMFEVPGLAHFAGACSPVVVLEDDRTLRNEFGVARRMPYCHQVAKTLGTTCHVDNEIHFRPTDGSNPATNGRAYTLELRREPPRSTLGWCDKQIWLFPGDQLSFPVSMFALKALHKGANILSMSGTVHSQYPKRANIRVEVLIEDEVVASGGIPAEAIGDDVGMMHIGRVPPSANEVFVRITSPPHAPSVLLRKVSMIDAKPAHVTRLRQKRLAWDRQHGRVPPRAPPAPEAAPPAQ